MTHENHAPHSYDDTPQFIDRSQFPQVFSKSLIDPANAPRIQRRVQQSDYHDAPTQPLRRISAQPAEHMPSMATPGRYDAQLDRAVLHDDTDTDTDTIHRIVAHDAPEKAGKSPLVKAGIAAVAITGTLLAGSFGIGALKGKQDHDRIKAGIEDIYNDKSTSAPVTPGSASGSGSERQIPGDMNGDGKYTRAEIQTMFPIVVKYLDVGFLVGAYAQQFNAERQSTYESMKQHLTPEQAAVLELPPAASDPRSFTDQDVLNAIAIDYQTSFSAADRTESQRMLPTIADKDSLFFEKSFESFEKGDGPLYQIINRHLESLPQPKGEFMGYDLSDASQVPRVIKSVWLADKNGSHTEDVEGYSLVVLNKAEDGQSLWQFVARWRSSDPDVQKAVQALYE